MITWDVPSVDGGAHVSNYIIEKREANMKSYKTVTTECRKTLFRITGLEEGLHYFFRVLPENIYGVGEPCETAEPVLVCEVPSVPLDLQVVDVSKSSVTLRWVKPHHDGGSRLTGYIIEACKVGSDRWSTVATTKASVSQYTIQSLMEKDQYLFRVRATNSRGSSEPMDTVTPVTIQDIKGKDPSGFSVQPCSGNTCKPDHDHLCCSESQDRLDQHSSENSLRAPRESHRPERPHQGQTPARLLLVLWRGQAEGQPGPHQDRQQRTLFPPAHP